MNSDARIELVVCGVFLMGLSLLTRYLDVTFGMVPLLTAVAVGVLCVVWAAARCHVGAIVTLPAAACVLAWEAVRLWRAPADAEADYRMAAMVMTVLVAFCLGTLANVLQRDGQRSACKR